MDELGDILKSIGDIKSAVDTIRQSADQSLKRAGDLDDRIELTGSVIRELSNLTAAFENTVKRVVPLMGRLETLAALAPAIEEISSQVGALHRRPADDTRQRDLLKRVDELAILVKDDDVELDLVKETVIRVENAVAHIKKDMEKIKEASTERLAGNGKRFDRVDQELREIKGAIASQNSSNLEALRLLRSQLTELIEESKSKGSRFRSRR